MENSDKLVPADELIMALDAQRERLYREMEREVPLPSVLYHVTLKKDVRRIIETGLKPSMLLDSDVPVVSLSDDLDFAVGVVCKQHSIPEEEAKKRLAVFEVETGYKGGGMDQDNFRNYLRKADTEARGADAPEIHEVHYVGVVPPEAIVLDESWNG